MSAENSKQDVGIGVIGSRLLSGCYNVSDIGCDPTTPLCPAFIRDEFFVLTCCSNLWHTSGINVTSFGSL